MRFSACAILAATAASAAPAPPTDLRREGNPATAHAWQRFTAQSHAALAALNRTAPAELPPPPSGVVDLQFGEFFGPIGDRGLEYSAKLRALAGRPVRIVGFMVREQERAPGLFLFSGWPVAVQTKGPCSFDDAPPSAVHVLLPAETTRPVPFRPGRLALIGRLEIGPRVEADGRNSSVRLHLDHAAVAQFAPSSPPPP